MSPYTWPDLIAPDPFLAQSIPVEGLGAALRELTENDIRYVLVHMPHIDTDEIKLIEEILPFVPIYRDALLTVFDLTSPMPALYDDMPISLLPTITLLDYEIQQAADITWRLSFLVQAEAAEVDTVACEVGLFHDDRLVAQSATSLFAPLSDGQLRMAGDLDYVAVNVELSDALPPGDYVWGLSCGEGQTYRFPDRLMRDKAGNDTARRRATDVTFGDAIRLGGYAWSTRGADLKLSLLWEALAPIDHEYMVFVHLTDEKGRVWSQYDAIPCAWLCPTQTWVPQDLVIDHAIVNLGGVPPGEYTLSVGLYDPLSMERLSSRVNDDVTVTENSFTFPDRFVIRGNARP